MKYVGSDKAIEAFAQALSLAILVTTTPNGGAYPPTADLQLTDVHRGAA
jgi:hypothetical protein